MLLACSVQALKAENEEQLYEPNVSSLPKVVIEQLEEIEREFEEGSHFLSVPMLLKVCSFTISRFFRHGSR